MKKKLLIISVLVSAFISAWVVLYPASGQEASPAMEGGAAFTVSRMVVATGVEDREPSGVAETFPSSTEKVYCFAEAADISEDTEVSFVWYHGNQEMLKTTLPLKKGKRWRTYAEKNLYGMTGDWKVDLQDSSGKAVKSVSFKVE